MCQNLKANVSSAWFETSCRVWSNVIHSNASQARALGGHSAHVAAAAAARRLSSKTLKRVTFVSRRKVLFSAHTPDNSFLGFAVQRRQATATKGNTALLYGKDSAYFQVLIFSSLFLLCKLQLALSRTGRNIMALMCVCVRKAQKTSSHIAQLKFLRSTELSGSSPTFTVFLTSRGSTPTLRPS